MMNNLLCKTFVMGALICSTQLSAQKVSDKQPWSVRMVDSLPGILATGFPAETEMGLLSWAGITSHAGCV